MLDCLLNGEISSHLPVTDRGLHYGDGVFETMAVFNGTPRFWQYHIDRLNIGCESIGLPQVAQSVLLREVQTVSAGHSECVVKVLITRGETGRGYAPPARPQSNRLVISFPFPGGLDVVSRRGLNTRICDLRLGIQPRLAGIKHLNRLEQVMARAEWTDPTIDEGILLDREDHVISATAGNIFLVSNERLLTPRMDRCGVRGVMRHAVLQAFMPVTEQRRISLDMLPEADEVFMTNAVRGIVPIIRIGHWEYDIGPQTRKLLVWLDQQ